MSRHYDTVLFDLFSALLDSWSVWGDLAGNPTLGREWRMHYLEATCKTERYEPYLGLVGESAKVVGVAKAQADLLADRWSELSPWPEVPDIIAELASTTKIGVVTNCSEDLGAQAALSLSVFCTLGDHRMTSEVRRRSACQCIGTIELEWWILKPTQLRLSHQTGYMGCATSSSNAQRREIASTDPRHPRSWLAPPLKYSPPRFRPLFSGHRGSAHPKLQVRRVDRLRRD